MVADPVLSDCNFKASTPIDLHGWPRIESWLEQRFAAHDRFQISRIANYNPADSLVAEVTFARRTSDELSALGAPHGIVPKIAAKVVFTRHDAIQKVAMGPVGGDASLCRIAAG